jgi:SAM-dependent methyltransferase
MSKDLKNYYEDDSNRFWSPINGYAGRDSHVRKFITNDNGVLLEYGFGSGSFLLNIAKERIFDKCIGYELSENAIKNFTKTYSSFQNKEISPIELYNSLEDKLKFTNDGSVDTIVCAATLEHVIDPYILLDEFYRIAKPGAKLILTVPNYAYIIHVIRLLFGDQPRTGTDAPVHEWRKEGWDGMHLHTFTKKSLNILLKDCGWDTSVWYGHGEKGKLLGFNYLRKKFPSKLSGELIVVCRSLKK